MESFLMSIGLSASTGYQPFIPLLIISIASKMGFIELASHSQWIGSTLFLCLMLVLSILDFFSGSIPFVGRIFEIIGIPITLLCGYIAFTSLTGTLGDNNIIVKQLIGILLGGGTAAIVRALTLVKNALSDTVTLGFSSTVNAVIDMITAIFVSIMAIVAPVVMCIVLAMFLFISYRMIRKLKRWKDKRSPKSAIG